MSLVLIGHDKTSLKLHGLVFVSHSQCHIPLNSRYRLTLLGDKYNGLADRCPEEGQRIIYDIGNPADLPTYEELTEAINWAGYPKVKTAWGLKSSEGLNLARYSLWEFYETVKDIPNLPHGVISWAAYAKPGDMAVFYQAATGIKFLCSLQEVENA